MGIFSSQSLNKDTLEKIYALEKRINQLYFNHNLDSNIDLFNQACRLRFSESSKKINMGDYSLNGKKLNPYNFKVLLLFCLEKSLQDLTLSKQDTVKTLKKDVSIYFLDPFMNVSYIDFKESFNKMLAFTIINLVQKNFNLFSGNEIENISVFLSTIDFRFFEENSNLLDKLWIKEPEVKLFPTDNVRFKFMKHQS